MDGRTVGEKLEQSDLVLVGLGEDFDAKHILRKKEEYRRGSDYLKEKGLCWLIPAWNEYCERKLGCSALGEALEKLRLLLENKNYFVVSVSTSSRIAGVPWKRGRLVMPCGTTVVKQCAGSCGGVLSEVTAGDRDFWDGIFEKIWEGSDAVFGENPLGICPECGAPLVLNTVYCENYNEEGYMEQWKLYRKWLQGTLNRRLLVLELGVGMEFPSVIRWPFEKAAFFNQKAFFCRVHDKLYQLTEELAGKGCGISQNAIDWLVQL